MQNHKQLLHLTISRETTHSTDQSSDSGADYLDSYSGPTTLSNLLNFTCLSFPIYKMEERVE